MLRSPIFSFIFAFVMFVAGALCFYCAVRGGILIALLAGALDWLAGSLLLYRTLRRTNAS